jgi:DNA-binding MarR family transcriptional regulator
MVTSRTRDADRRLVGLDHALLEVRRLVNRPGYRRRLLGPLGRRVELSTVRVLHAVDQAQVPPSIGAIATTLGIDPSTASRLIEQRVVEGLLERSPDVEDRRRSTLRLTDRGCELLDELAASRREMLSEVTRGWSAAERSELERLLGRLIEGFRALEVDDRG